MKRFTITQYGVEEVDYERRFVVEVPDSMHEGELKEDVLLKLAFETPIAWECVDGWCEGICFTDQDIEPASEDDDELPVLQYPATSDVKR